MLLYATALMRNNAINSDVVSGCTVVGVEVVVTARAEFSETRDDSVHCSMPLSFQHSARQAGPLQPTVCEAQLHTDGCGANGGLLSPASCAYA